MLQCLCVAQWTTRAYLRPCDGFAIRAGSCVVALSVHLILHRRVFGTCIFRRNHICCLAAPERKVRFRGRVAGLDGGFVSPHHAVIIMQLARFLKIVKLMMVAKTRPHVGNTTINNADLTMTFETGELVLIHYSRLILQLCLHYGDNRHVDPNTGLSRVFQSRIYAGQRNWILQTRNQIIFKVCMPFHQDIVE